MSSGEALHLNSIRHPGFNQQQLAFFRELTKLYKQDRLGLDPRDTPKKLFDLQWNSLVSGEAAIQWLIDSTLAIQEAEVQERINNTEYDPQKLLATISDDSVGVDLANMTI